MPAYEIADLIDLNQREDYFRDKLGGLKGILSSLEVSVSKGLNATQVSSNKERFGMNYVPKTPPRSFISLFWEAIQDFTLVVLIVSAVVSIVLESTMSKHKETGWVSGTAILFAVLLVSTVTSLNNWSKERQFRKLEATDRAMVSVIRDGALLEVDVVDVVVGDIIGIRTGDLICADGIFIEGSNLSCDESAMTGESLAVKKSEAKPFFLSGTKAIEGEGKMVVTSVGVHTEIGRIKSSIDEESGDTQTPLEEKLEQMAKDIGKIGLVVAIMTVIVSVIWWLVTNMRKPKIERFTRDENLKLIDFFILGVTILVVAIPEGLPLAVTISLAYSMQRMTKDKCLVRKLAACETCGGVTNICSDKTGTLTENNMTACELMIAGKHHKTLPGKDEVGAGLLDPLSWGIVVNSTAFLAEDPKDPKGPKVWSGNKTEMALLVMAEKKFGVDWAAARQRYKPDAAGGTIAFPFSSAKKSMATLVPDPAGGKGSVLYVKGAPEILLEFCTHQLTASGEVARLGSADRKAVSKAVDDMANGGLRTMLLAQKSLTRDEAKALKGAAEPPYEDLVLVGVAGIKDPLREGVPEAVGKCLRAGIFVRMVTGDNVGTAKAIARECGILTDGVVIEGPAFRALSHEERIALLPKLQVIARSSPTDKYLLVKTLIDLGEVVAVTGDGTNDAAALAKADVGLAMGIAGTQVAKDAADIIILDDNFASIVRAIMWGRSVYDSVRKFLQFQLTINLVALLLVFIATCARLDTPLTPVQMLWVNLIMDTFAALALGTEKPTEDILNRPPYGRFDPLINKQMMRNMVGGAIMQLAVLLTLLFYGDNLFKVNAGSQYADNKTLRDDSGRRLCAVGSSVHYTIVFNVFVILQLFNEISSHKLHDDGPSVFHGFFENPIFLSVLFGSAAFQAFIVEVGAGFTQTCPLRWYEWLITIGIGFFALPWGFFVRCFKVSDLPPVDPDRARKMAAVHAAEPEIKPPPWLEASPAANTQSSKGKPSAGSSNKRNLSTNSSRRSTATSSSAASSSGSGGSGGSGSSDDSDSSDNSDSNSGSSSSSNSYSDSSGSRGSSGSGSSGSSGS